MLTFLAVLASGWAVLMAVAPLLQMRRMVRRRSSADVSLAYLLVLVPGFGLWVAYGLASGDLALVIPNCVAFVVGAATIGCAVHLRRAATAPAGPIDVAGRLSRRRRRREPPARAPGPRRPRPPR